MYTTSTNSKKKQKQVARDWYQEEMWNCDSMDYLYEDAKMIGLHIEEINMDRPISCKGEFDNSAQDTAHKIVEEHGPQCKTHKTSKTFLEERDKFMSAIKYDKNNDLVNEYEIEKLLNECNNQYLKSICEDYLILFQQEQKHFDSNEFIDQRIREANHKFRGNGKKFEEE